MPDGVCRMPVPILCPFCGVSGSVPERSRGKHCRCPKCGNRFMVPALATAPEFKPVSSPPPVRRPPERIEVSSSPFDFWTNRKPETEEAPLQEPQEEFDYPK